MRRLNALQRRSVLAMAMLLLAASTVDAQTWQYTPSVSLRETATNNVNLSPPGSEQSDFVTEIRPKVHVLERGPRSALDATIELPAFLYARTGAANNNIFPAVNLAGTVQPVDHFFVDGNVHIAELVYSPFGARPLDLSTATNNRYRSSSYEVSPYLKGVAQQGIEYELRNRSIWTLLNSAPQTTADSYVTEWVANLASAPSRFAWRANYDYTDTRFTGGNTIKTQIGRFVPMWNVDPEWQLNASAGYESNDYALTSSSNAVYGAGFLWQPTPATKAVGLWEHRYFGSSYRVSFDTRTPLSVWNIQTSRNVTTYPKQIAAIPSGVDVNSLLNSLFLSRIPDPVERQRIVDAFISDRGLPPVLTSPIVVYDQQIVLQRSTSASAGLLGVRNSIMFTLYTLYSQPISASGDPLPPFLAGTANNNTQSGAAVSWTHKLTPSLLLTSTLTGSETRANSPFTEKTKQWGANVELSQSIAPRTNVIAGARYQASRSESSSDYTETALYVGVRHDFR